MGLTQRWSGCASPFSLYPSPSANPAASLPPAASDAAAATAAVAWLHNDHLSVSDKIVAQERKVLVDHERRRLDDVGKQYCTARNGGSRDCRTAHHASKELTTIHRFHFPLLQVSRAPISCIGSWPQQ
jgi:hypothetical protein